MSFHKASLRTVGQIKSFGIMPWGYFLKTTQIMLSTTPTYGACRIPTVGFPATTSNAMGKTLGTIVTMAASSCIQKTFVLSTPQERTNLTLGMECIATSFSIYLSKRLFQKVNTYEVFDLKNLSSDWRRKSLYFNSVVRTIVRLLC